MEDSVPILNLEYSRTFFRLCALRLANLPVHINISARTHMASLVPKDKTKLKTQLQGTLYTSVKEYNQLPIYIRKNQF